MPAVLERLNGHFAGRVATTVVVISATMVVYWLLNDHLRPRYDFYSSLDASIPFLPWTLPVYLSFYLMMVIAAWVTGADEFIRLFTALLIANVACYISFVMFTAHYPRPSLAEIPELWRPIYAWMYGSDAPGNTFPSIHVASTMIVGMRLAKRHPGWLVWASAIAISTLTVKQHFVVDVWGGIALGFVASAIAFRTSTEEATNGA